MPSRCLFIDMNAFYASVEQQERPELRGKPVIVVPLRTESTCAIAVSYEAKRWGVKTGTSVRTARKLCPNVRIVEARPSLYLQYHAAIVEELERLFVRVQVLSVDEMVCRISPFYATREAEMQRAREVKESLYKKLGPMMHCSIGIGPNVFLAKVASEMQKPNGLTVLDADNLPEALFGLSLADLPGIGRRMAARLERHGITSVQTLWEASAHDLRRVWGSVVGERWWLMLRGNQTADYGVEIGGMRKSVGHSHVLPPECRTESGVKAVLLRLFSKAMKRLRSYGLAAGAVQIQVEFWHTRKYTSSFWSRRSTKHIPANDDITWLGIVRPLLAAIPTPEPGYQPLCVGITFTDLIACRDVNLSLFEDRMQRARLCAAVDMLDARSERGIDLASTYGLRHLAPRRIPFGQPDRIAPMASPAAPNPGAALLFHGGRRGPCSPR